VPPTLRDIAQKTGLDVSTVSRVLNNDTSRGVSEGKRQQVLAVAEQIGYRPHRSARALRTGRHMNIAYVMADAPATRSNLELPFARFRLYGIEEVLSARGYLISLLRLDPASPRSLQERVLRSPHVDALVFNFVAPSLEVVARLRAAGLAAVLLDGDLFEESGRAISCILTDRKAGTHASVSHLIEHGHQRIALVNAVVNRRRTEGYLSALAAHDLPRDPRLIRQWADPDASVSTGRLKGYRAAQELLAEKVPFTAVQAGSDHTAAGVIDALTEAGLRVPEDVAVAGFDDVDEMGLPLFPQPFLTTVADPNHELGRRAAEQLLAQVEDGADPARIVLPTRLVIRHSCGPHPPA
jgi:LacI family transcriptional regulator